MSVDECKTYLGSKGYSIYKDKISVKEQQYIRDQLTVRPYVPKAPVQPPSFPIYLESPKKLYVPRYFGEELYGKPDEYRIGEGDDISLEFKGELRDFQKDVVNKFLKSVDDDTGCGGGLIDVFCGGGKCNGLDTPIIMYDGTIMMVQDVKVGDQLMGDDSTPRNVLSLARGREMMYDVIPNKGDTYTVNQSHILSLKCSTNFNKKYRKGEVYDIPLLDYLDLPKSYHGRGGPLLGYRVGVEFEPRMIELEPYALGYWLGDGTCANSQITTEEDCVVKYFKDYADTIGCSVTQGKDSLHSRASLHYNIVGKMIEGKRLPNKMLKMLQGYDLIKNKHIPDDFKYNSRKVRLELLAGIIDSDGSATHNSYDLIQKNETLMDDIIYLVRSLGFAAYKKECKKSCMYKGEKKEGTYYRTTIHGKGLEEIPVKCERKKVEPRKQIKDALVTRIKIEPVGVDDYYGFELDGNHRYLLGDFTVTHNTVMGINIISKIKKKTLIIVHKTFLLNQWIERIEEFLPDAKVGSIQGQVIDIEGKDIVIGMLQSLSMKSYPSDLFSCFGLTVIDECFPANTFIHTNKGKITIHNLYKIWGKEKQDNDIQILSYNINNECFEYKSLTHAWQKKNDNLIKISCSKRQIKCTLNHKILSMDGYIEADKLEIGDIIKCKYDDTSHGATQICKGLNDDQLQVIYGSFLGDGFIDNIKSGRQRLGIIHGEKQKDYCQWKANMFGIDELDIVEENGYAKTRAYKFCSKCFDLKDNLTNSKIVPEWLINKIDERGIAIWFMDDGSNQKYPVKNGDMNNSVRIHSNNFDYENNIKLQRMFQRFDIECGILKSKDKYYYLAFDKMNSSKLVNLIKDYIHPNLENKLENISSNKYKWNNKFLNYGTLRITKKKYVNNKTGMVYDIEVKDNHNFIVGSSVDDAKQPHYTDGFIVSNCHHIGSEVFGQALQKIVTPVTLGLSATMQRKDGLTRVFKMFLGEIVYKMKRESEDNVLVKGIIYNVEDQEYNEVKYDWKGNPLYSSMISKVCGYSDRTEFILSVIKQELSEKSGQQIMVLAQQKNILIYLDKAIRFHNIASVGFYVGGMKEKDLKETENKTIVLATYAMAAEGLDIKTLTSMILASPRTDITQSVGRILRVKHERPLVVDIIDSHDVFKRQWEKRLAFYKKNKYKVIKTTNDNYKNDSWETIYDKEIKVEKKKKEVVCMVSM